MNLKNIYYNYLAFQNNIILNFILIANLFFPKQMKKNIIYYKKKSDEYYNYIFLLSINDEIEEKYHINILNIGLTFYNKYKNLIKNDIDNMSEIDELSDLDEDL